MGRAQRGLMQKGTPILMYHRVGPPPPETRDPFLYVTPARLDAHLASLLAAGFGSGSLDELKTQRPGETNKAVITFDDGFSSVMDHGLDVLSRRGFRAIQFLVAGFIGGRNEWDISKGDVAESLMDKDQGRTWLAAGHEIGSHSNTHRNLRHLDPLQAREEISGSKKALEDRFGVPVRHFCYPFGSWNESVRDLVGEAGYHTACSLVFGVNTATTPSLELRRIEPLSTTEMLSKVRHRLQRKLRERTSH